MVVLNFNGSKTIVQCISSVLASEYHKIEVILVDNGSSDSSVKCVRTRFRDDVRLQIVELHRNLGFAGGNNAGFAASKGRLVIFLNNDTVVKKDWISGLLGVMNSDLRVGACQSKLRQVVLPEVIDCAGGILYSFGYAAEEGNGEVDKGQYDHVRDISYAKGASLCVRRRIFEDLCGFDDNYFLLLEEVDLCLRIWKLGYRVVLAPSSVVWHVGSASMATDSDNSFYLSSKNRPYLLYANYELRTLVSAMPNLCLTDLYFLLKSIRYGKPHRFVSIVRGKFWFVRNMKKAVIAKSRNEKLRQVSDNVLLGRVIPQANFMSYLMSTAPDRFGVMRRPNGEIYW